MQSGPHEQAAPHTQSHEELSVAVEVPGMGEVAFEQHETGVVVAPPRPAAAAAVAAVAVAAADSSLFFAPHLHWSQHVPPQAQEQEPSSQPVQSLQQSQSQHLSAPFNGVDCRSVKPSGLAPLVGDEPLLPILDRAVSKVTYYQWLSGGNPWFYSLIHLFSRYNLKNVCIIIFSSSLGSYCICYM